MQDIVHVYYGSYTIAFCLQDPLSSQMDGSGAVFFTVGATAGVSVCLCIVCICLSVCACVTIKYYP